MQVALIWTMPVSFPKTLDHAKAVSSDTFLTRRSGNASSLFTVAVKETKITFCLLRIAR